MTDHEKTKQQLLEEIEWLLEDESVGASESDEGYTGQNYGDLVQLNTKRTIADSVGPEILREIAGDYLDLLGSSGAIYETNGDYALGIFSSGWCRFMDQASRDLCHTEDDQQALNGGAWHCHESCWSCSQQSMDTGRPADVECRGGIRLYAVPVVADGKIVGSINFGYGSPPQDKHKLQELAERYQKDVGALREKAATYRSRPPFIVELAKKRLQTAAHLIGEIIARKSVEDELAHANDELERKNSDLERFNKMAVGRELQMVKLKRDINDLSLAAGKEPPYNLPEDACGDGAAIPDTETG